MVFVIYSHGPKVALDSTRITVNEAVDKVKPADKSGPFVVAFNGRFLNGEQLLSEVPDLRPHHTLRVLSKTSHPATLENDSALAENLVAAVENMSDAELQRVADYVGKDSFKRTFLLTNPNLIDTPEFLNLLADFTQWSTALKTEPGFATYAKRVLDQAISTDAMGVLLNGSGSSALPQPELGQFLGRFQPQASASNNAPRISEEALRSAFQFVLQGQNEGPTAPTQPSDPHTQYSQQLAQFHEFGFTNDEENVQFLVAAEGNFEAALELLIRSREE